MIASLIISVILIGVSLSVDAFAVSVCDGMIYRGIKKRTAILIPLTFGFFQAAMPIVGFYIGKAFLQLIDSFDHWVAFALLCLIGGNMIIGAIKDLRSDKTEEEQVKKFSFPSVLVQGVATSIDALAVGFSLNAMLEDVVTNTVLWAWISVAIIGCTTFLISLVGVFIGVKAGNLFKKKASVAQIIGGCVLVLLGIKIVLGAYFNLPF